MASKRLPYVFISYSNADLATCQTLYDNLTRKLGRIVFLSANINPVAVDFEPFMWKVFNESYAILVVVSPNSAGSVWVKREVEAAFKRKASDPSLLIIPLLIGDMRSAASAVSMIHPDLGRYHYADFTMGVNQSEALSQLLYVLRHPERAINPIGPPGGPLTKIVELRPWWLRTLRWVGKWILWIGGVQSSQRTAR